MKIREIEAFQVQWAPEDKPAQCSAWVRVHCDDGSFGIGEASPMQGGLASLGIVKHNLAPARLAQAIGWRAAFILPGALCATTRAVLLCCMRGRGAIASHST